MQIERMGSAILLGLSLAAVSGCFRLPDPVPTNNPKPRGALRAWMTVADQTPHGVTADAHYQIFNDYNCLRIDNARALGGAYPLGITHIDVPVRTTASGFEAIVFTDRFKDQKYYPEKAACVWSLIGITFTFEVEGKRYQTFVQNEGRIPPFVPRKVVSRCEPTQREINGLPRFCFPEAAQREKLEPFFAVTTGAGKD
jgi:hypothetical protein